MSKSSSKRCNEFDERSSNLLESCSSDPIVDKLSLECATLDDLLKTSTSSNETSNLPFLSQIAKTENNNSESFNLNSEIPESFNNINPENSNNNTVQTKTPVVLPFDESTDSAEDTNVKDKTRWSDVSASSLTTFLYPKVAEPKNFNKLEAALSKSKNSSKFQNFTITKKVDLEDNGEIEILYNGDLELLEKPELPQNPVVAVESEISKNPEKVKSVETDSAIIEILKLKVLRLEGENKYLKDLTKLHESIILKLESKLAN